MKQVSLASSRQMSRTREDQDSKAPWTCPQPTPRPIWRHEARLTGLIPGSRIPYRVCSYHDNGESLSQVFSVTAAPGPDQPLRILLTSDHQLKPMVAANLQKVAETLGSVDAVFLAGDLVNVADRASEWFDEPNAFFRCLQGRADFQLAGQSYRGGALIQSAPLFPTIGNHEVMGRWGGSSLEGEFGDSHPVSVARSRLPSGLSDPQKADWIRDHSFNTLTYDEIFARPGVPEPRRYYAETVGGIRLVSLYVTHIWRWFGLDPHHRGRYREREEDLNLPEQWGYGQHIFEPIGRGSAQYQWLEEELHSPEFHQAQVKIVMLHNPPHSLGGNVVPAFTDPLQVVERDAFGHITAVRYEYPMDKDYLVHDLVPLLDRSGVDLVYYGHCHLWNRFVSPTGMHFLEASNVGNSYGAFWPGQGRERIVPTDYQERYVGVGNPNGLAPVVPSLEPLVSDTGDPLPFVASNEWTVFSVLDFPSGTVSSYRFNTQDPGSPVICFDQFKLGRSPSHST